MPEPATVAVALLVLAALPWLGTIFKSLSTPLGGAEYRVFTRKLQEVAGVAQNAVRIAEASEAVDFARQEVLTNRNSASVVELAATYDTTRANMRSGNERTDELTSIVGRMVVAYQSGADIDVIQFLSDKAGGKRLAAYVRLYVKPDGSHLVPLIDALSNEAQAFCQYWALRGLSRIVETQPDAMDRNSLRRLERLAAELQPNSDRRYLIGRVLARF